MLSVKRVLTILLLFVSVLALGQYKVTVVDQQIYTAYVSDELKEPLYVVYKLHKTNASNCDREGEHYSFKATDGMLGTTEYKGSGYDKGHLAPADDFGSDCEATFRYNNCLPQDPTLNRGIWKKVETNLRALSKKKELMIVCGGTFGDQFVKQDGKLIVPKFFWKIVIDKDTNKVLHCWIFPNDKSGSILNISLDDLKKRLGYTLNYKL